MLLDPRTHAYRPDIAAIELQGKVEAVRFEQGVDYKIISGIAPVFKTSEKKSLTTEALAGEIFRVYDIQNDIAWGQLLQDRYVGYIKLDHLSKKTQKNTHKIIKILTHIYSEPDLKTVPSCFLTLNAQVSVMQEQNRFFKIDDNKWIFADHLTDNLDTFEKDFVKTAHRFLDVPYLWGGKSALGVDCSGLVQLSLHASGIDAPRDSDMQSAQIGHAIDPYEPIQRGDLIFFPGHVGIMLDDKNILHANATHMCVTIEPLKIVSDRAAEKDGKGITGIRRLILAD